MASELRRLQASPDDLVQLTALEVALIDRIRRCERHQRRYRTMLAGLKAKRRSRLSKAESLAVKDAMGRCVDAIDALQYKARVWRAFGDGIAHIYLDKYALKQTLYNATDFSPKEEAGFLDGKAGFDGEWALTLDALESGVPALLSDLTNIIRHGDVCLMGESTPVLIEVKSSGNQNMRTVRQSRSLQAVQSFLQTDVSTELRGLGRMIRRSLPANDVEVNHYTSINDAMREALAEGWSIVQPEPGVLYACGHVDASDGEAFGAALNEVVMGMPGPPRMVTYALSEARRDNTWGHYTPYVLSLEPTHAGLFIAGRVLTLVFVDLNRVVELFAGCGVTCTVLPEGPWMFEIETLVDGKRPGASRISKGLFGRIAFDFQSLEWFVRTQVAVTVEMSAQAGVDWSLPIEWPALLGT